MPEETLAILRVRLPTDWSIAAELYLLGKLIADAATPTFEEVLAGVERDNERERHVRRRERARLR